MARARIRKNPRRRRRDYQMKKLLQGLCASVDQQDAQADGTGDGAEPAGTALPSDKDAPGPKTASTADQKTPSSEPKQRRKYRKVPDRHYYNRPEKMERQYLGLQRRVTSVVDEKVAKGAAALDKWKRDAGAFMDKFKCKEKKEREALERHLNNMRQMHRMQLNIHERRISLLWSGLERVKKQCAKLRNEGKDME